jgi:hypothetical protein
VNPFALSPNTFGELPFVKVREVLMRVRAILRRHGGACLNARTRQSGSTMGLASRTRSCFAKIPRSVLAQPTCIAATIDVAMIGGTYEML